MAEKSIIIIITIPKVASSYHISGKTTQNFYLVDT